MSRFHTTGAYESPFRENVSWLTITDKQLEGKNTEKNKINLYDLPWKNGTDAVNPRLSEVSQSRTGNRKERWLTTSKFGTVQTIYHYRREASSPAGNPRSFYSYTRNEILFRQSGIDGELQKVVPTSLHVLMLYFSLASYPGYRWLYNALQPEYYWPNVANDTSTMESTFTAVQHLARELVIRSNYVSFQPPSRYNLWQRMFLDHYKRWKTATNT